MQAIKNPTFGTDPEFAIINVVTNEPICAFGKVPGDKKNPADIGNGCGIQPDGVNVELTIPPVSTKDQFVSMIMYGKNEFQRIFTNIDPNLRVISASSLLYNDEQLSAPEVRIFGCDPSWNLYTQNHCVKPSAEEVGNMRCAGFHIHMGVKYLLSVEEIERYIYCMDIMCGLPSVVLDKDRDRKRLYGQAGDFRMNRNDDLTIVEYRTLGGNLHGSEQHIAYFFDQTNKAIELYNSLIEYPEYEDLPEKFRFNWHDVQKAIDGGDENAAKKLMEVFGVTVDVNPIFNEVVEQKQTIYAEMVWE